MFNSGSGYSLSDIAAVSGNCGNNGNDMWGNGAWWIIILFLFCFNGWGNGRWGDNGGGSSTTREEVAYGFDMNGLENGIRGVQSGLCDGFYAMNTGMLNGFAGIQSTLCQGFAGVNDAVTNSGYNTLQAINANTVAGMQNTNALTAQLNSMSAANAACCCDIERQVERGFCDLNYNLATQSCDTRRAIADSTRDLLESNNAGVRSILDFLTQDKIATLQSENQSLRLAASQAAQNNYLISSLSPKPPVPAWIVPNPATPYNPCTGTYYNYNGGCCCNQGCGC